MRWILHIRGTTSLSKGYTSKLVREDFEFNLKSSREIEVSFPVEAEAESLEEALEEVKEKVEVYSSFEGTDFISNGSIYEIIIKFEGEILDSIRIESGEVLKQTEPQEHEIIKGNVALSLVEIEDAE